MTTGQANRPFEITEDMLHGYVDGQLPPAQRASVEAWLATPAEKAAEVAQWRRQNAALTTLFGPVAGEPLPDRLNPRRIAARNAARQWDWTRLAAAAIVVIAVSVGAGWFLRTATWQEEPRSDRLIDGALLAHSLYVKESRHAVEVAADDKAHLVTWLSNRLGRPIDTPDLAPEGFTLVGGRLLPPLPDTGTGPAAQLMYQNKTSNRLTVYITAAINPPGPAYKTYTEDGLEAYYWANSQITCTVIGDLPQSDMTTVARGVFQQLTWRPDPTGRT
ncbi:MAG: anti-sigma factor family protein [Devosia sp.]